MYERFTDRARKVMQLANQEAQRLHHEYIGTEHLLLGLIKEGSGVAANVLKNLDIDLRRVRQEVEKLVQSSPDMPIPGKLPQTPRAKKVVEYAVEEARNVNHNYVGTEHLLLGLLREEEGVASQVLMNLGLRLKQVREEVLALLGNTTIEGTRESAIPLCEEPYTIGNKSKTPALDSFGRDLTELARQNKLTPLVGRNGMIERMLVVLGGRTRFCLLLVGESGVGKKALVEGLAGWVGAGRVPEGLPVERLVAVDMGLLLAGVPGKWRRQELHCQFVEGRLNTILREAAEARVALSFESLPLLFAEWAQRVLGMFHAVLRQSSVPIIAAIRPREYRAHLTSNPDLTDLFEPLFVKPLSEEDTLEVLRNQREAFEKHHRVSITDQALSRAVELAELSLKGCLPGKAVRLLDRAAGLVRLRTHVPTPDLKEMEARIDAINREKEEAVAEQDFARAARLRDEGDKLKKRREQLVAEWDQQVRQTGLVEPESVAEALTRMLQGQETRSQREPETN
jgi:ATP-dependent Clp protease ATP-binding subunit ClpC